MSAYTGSIPDTAARRRDWAEEAACRDEDLELFFSDLTQHQARTLCVVHCPVRAACLESVMAAESGKGRDHRHGIFAGLDGRQRWRLDPDAPGKDEEEEPAADPQPCGTAEALERHLAHGEQVDDRCWSGEVRRVRHRSGPRDGRFEPEPDPVQQPSPMAEPDLLTAVPEPEPAPAPELAAPSPVPKPRPRPRGDTPHERRIYTLWMTGASDLDIARRMAVSVPSVRRVRERLGLLPNLHARAS
ncbi:WhiB family transcriptional regulator [Streptomyces sp. NPDC001406]|uniref:WhiB family transcriptional regulator n=1 Tax=Streptomyces sp. NPDC001406 TaxID=3364572 RepID=UPI0036A6920B